MVVGDAGQARVREHAKTLLGSEPAARLPRASRVRKQPQGLEGDRIADLPGLHGLALAVGHDVPFRRVAVARSVGATPPRQVDVPKELFPRVVVSAARDVVAGGVGAGRNALGQQLAKRVQHGLASPRRRVGGGGEDGCRVRRVDERAGPGDELDAVHEAAVQGDFGVYGRYQRPYDGGLGAGEGAVDGAHDLGVRFAEIRRDLLLRLGDRHPNGKRTASPSVVFDDVFPARRAVGDLLESGAESAPRVVEGIAHAGTKPLQPVSVDEVPDSPFGHDVGGDLRLDVAPELIRHPHVAQQKPPDVLVDLPGVNQPDGGEDEAFLDHVLRRAGPAARGHAADVGPVAAVCGEAHALTPVEDGPAHHGVGLVGPPVVRVVVEEHVAFRD